MNYREGVRSRSLYIIRENIKKIHFLSKKIKKRWRQRKEYISKEYWENKINNENKKEDIVNVKADSDKGHKLVPNEKVAIYTCVFGNYDKILEPVIKGKNCDYYIITDQEISTKSAWKKVELTKHPIGFETWHPAIKNRYYKMHPHEVFDEYNYSLYIDGNVRPITDLYPFLVEMDKQGKILALFKHPIFNCLYDAAEHLKKINLVDVETMDKQMEKYKLQNFPEKYGFFECNIILRKHHEDQCKKIMNTWWSEYQNGVKRDQQCFTYALWKNGYTFSDVCTLGLNVRENSRVKLRNHKREHQKV